MRQKKVRRLRKEALEAMKQYKRITDSGANGRINFPEGSDTEVCPYKNFIRKYRRNHG